MTQGENELHEGMKKQIFFFSKSFKTSIVVNTFIDITILYFSQDSYNCLYFIPLTLKTFTGDD